MPDDMQKDRSRKGGGASSGPPYPSPHDGKKGGKADTYMGHGGQTDMEYHGTGRLGHRKTGDNANAPAANDGDKD